MTRDRIVLQLHFFVSNSPLLYVLMAPVSILARLKSLYFKGRGMFIARRNKLSL